MPDERPDGNIPGVGGRRLLTGALFAGVTASTLALADPCLVNHLTSRSAEIACNITADGTGLARVEVRLEGFHDDSSASLALKARGGALPCSPEDPAVRSGEDGDQGEVTLTCAFDLTILPRGTALITGLVQFNHAEFTGARLVPVSPAKP